MGTYTAPLAASEVWFGGDGIVFSDDATRTSHNSELIDCNVAQFNNGVVMGAKADHIKISGGSIGGCLDGILVKSGNENDLGITSVDVTGSRRSSYASQRAHPLPTSLRFAPTSASHASVSSRT